MVSVRAAGALRKAADPALTPVPTGYLINRQLPDAVTLAATVMLQGVVVGGTAVVEELRAVVAADHPLPACCSRHCLRNLKRGITCVPGAIRLHIMPAASAPVELEPRAPLLASGGMGGC